MNASPESEPQHNKKFADWLEQLQLESWQLELIISGIALLGIWEARTLIGALYSYIQVYPTAGVQRAFSFFLYIGLKIGWMILFSNLIIHIISRGIWIGAIGLRYISGDIDYQEI